MWNDDEHVRETYAHFGVAVYFAQVLEHAIVNAMVVLRIPRKDRLDRGDIDAFMDGQFEKTLGRLIRDLRADTPLSSELEELLREALKMRNWLCHDYFRERAVDFVTSEGREKMIHELKLARKLLQQADRALEAAIQPIADRFGLSNEVVDAECRRMLDEHRMMGSGSSDRPS